MEWDDQFVENVADPAGLTPEEQLMHGQIIDAFKRLPEAQRAVMLLVAVEGLSYQETAEAIGVPIGTVMSRLSRARQAIGARFGGNAGGNAGRQGSASAASSADNGRGSIA